MLLSPKLYCGLYELKQQLWRGFWTHSSHWWVNLNPSKPSHIRWLPSHQLLWLCHGWDPAWTQDTVVHLHQVKPRLTQTPQPGGKEVRGQMGGTTAAWMETTRIGMIQNTQAEKGVRCFLPYCSQPSSCHCTSPVQCSGKEQALPSQRSPAHFAQGWASFPK